jgi:hypothetical protein
LIIDPKEGDVDVIVSIQILRGGAKGHLPADDKKTHVGLARESVVQVRYLPSLGSGAVMLLCDIRDHASMVTRGKGQSARAGCGDHGSMHPVGMRIMKEHRERTCGTRHLGMPENGSPCAGQSLHLPGWLLSPSLECFGSFRMPKRMVTLGPLILEWMGMGSSCTLHIPWISVLTSRMPLTMTLTMPHRDVSASGLKMNREALGIGTLFSQMCTASGPPVLS